MFQRVLSRPWTNSLLLDPALTNRTSTSLARSSGKNAHTLTSWRILSQPWSSREVPRALAFRSPSRAMWRATTKRAIRLSRRRRSLQCYKTTLSWTRDTSMLTWPTKPLRTATMPCLSIPKLRRCWRPSIATCRSSSMRWRQKAFETLLFLTSASSRRIRESVRSADLLRECNIKFDII